MQRGTAVLVTVLLHLLLVLLVTLPPPLTTATPHGEANGSRMEVRLLDQALPQAPPVPPEPVPAVRKPASIKKPKAARVIKRAPATPVVQATVAMPPEAADTADTQAAASPDAQADNTVVDFPSRTRMDEAARANAALAAKLGGHRARSDNAPPAGPNMGVDGFHVYYELADENRLRAWRNQGMTELFLPLPGTRRLMVCPLEIALRRGSGKCRMVEMDSPELENVGDAREVIDIARVYQWGEMVWSGPGPYR